MAGRIARSSPVTRQLIRYYSYSDRIYQPAVSLSENEKRQEIVGSYNIYIIFALSSHALCPSSSGLAVASLRPAPFCPRQADLATSNASKENDRKESRKETYSWRS